MTPEIIVVDSGSTDATLALAHREADRVLEIPAERFSFGHALNVGAAAARAPIHFALSSHALPLSDRWIEQSLSKYDRPDLAATNGALALPVSRKPLASTFFQSLDVALMDPAWGHSNTGCSWRARVWAGHPFDEDLPACEDKEWALRVLSAGWTIAFDPELCTTDSHRTEHGLLNLYRRTRLEFTAMSSFVALPSYTRADFVSQWLTELQAHGLYRRWRQRCSPVRIAELLGKYHGLKADRGPHVAPARRWHAADPCALRRSAQPEAWPA